MASPPDHLLSPHLRLSDGAVALRPWREDDAAALAEAWCDPSIYRWTLVPEGLSEEEVRRWIAHTAERAARSKSVQLAVVDSDAGQLLGGIGLTDFDWENAVAEIFYWTEAGARRRGVASHAVTLLSRWAFTDLGVARLELFTHIDNAGSQRVAERCGYKREGVLRSCRVVKGERTDLVIFSLLSIDVQPPSE